MDRQDHRARSVDVALHGTIDSFPIVDVLQLLSGSAKTGRLELVGNRGRATLWAADGLLTAGTAQGRPCVDPAQALWELLRYSDGSFEFHDGDLPPSPGFEPVAVGEMIERATQMQGEWLQIESRVPSLSHRVEPVAELPGSDVRLSADDWAVVVSAGRAPSVATLMEQLDFEEFEGCRRIAELVDRGLLVVEEPGYSPEVPQDQPLDAPLDQPIEPSVVQPIEVAAASEAPQVGAEAFATEVPVETPQEAVSTVDSLAQPLVEPAEPAASGFPEHFPIDDLVAGSESSWEQAPDPAGESAFVPDAAPTTQAEVPPDPYWDQAGAHQDHATAPGHPDPHAASPVAPVEPVQHAHPGDPHADDVLAQIGRLSPKAAEAIAAALGDSAGSDPAG
jgi:hypothetical protein